MRLGQHLCMAVKSIDDVLALLERWAAEEPDLVWERDGETMTIPELAEEVRAGTPLGKLVVESLLPPTRH
jgi:hypothetical protein